ncbi:MAG: hypothetical protein AAF570_10055 [Bacteroidota bacterium]
MNKGLLLAVIGIFMLLSQALHAQTDAFPRTIERMAYQADFHPLKVVHGKKKSMPRGIEMACLLALSRFPELKQIPIEFVVQKESAARVEVLRTSGRKSPPAFQIALILPNSALSFNAKVGLIAHALVQVFTEIPHGAAHLEAAGLKKSTRKHHPAIAKLHAETLVHRGLGWQFHDFTEHHAPLHISHEDVRSMLHTTLAQRN